MAVKKLCGIDLNGIKDFAARNWVLGSDGEYLFGETHINEGAFLSSVVELHNDKGGGSDYIGGVQAELAPHGKGGGYGETGHSKYRTALRDIICSPQPDIERLRAGISGIVPTPTHAIVSMSDSEATTEAYQEALILALQKNKVKSFLLIWRSVLVALNAIERGEVVHEKTIGVISHSAAGVDIQKLKIKSFDNNNQAILVPERHEVGQSVPTKFGYKGLLSLARAELNKLISSRFDNIEHAKNISLLALGHPTVKELIRRENGDWVEIVPPESLEGIQLITPTDFNYKSYFNDCEKVFYETLVEGQMQSRFLKFFEKELGKEIKLITGTSVCEAGLYAAIRLEADIPIYFDFLPQISTIVQRGADILNFDLIDQSETLRAGKAFRSKDPAILGMSALQETVIVHLRKETEERPRKASVKISVPPNRTIPVKIWVEQIPALGRAKIQIRAEEINLAEAIDWDEAEEIDETWENLIENLDVPNVPLPKRLMKEASEEKWVDFDGGGLIKIIPQQVSAVHPNWKYLTSKISGSISSDGEIPDIVNRQTREDLEKLSKQALEHIEKRLTGKIVSDNLSLRFLTWQFKLCPAELSQTLIDLWPYRETKGFRHPFITSPNSWVLFFQGVGRIVFEPALEKKAIKLMLDIPIKKWRYREQTACMSFLLSRSKTAHKFLKPADIPILLSRVEIEFRESLGTNYAKFLYAPFLLAGLLRYREIEPRSLVIGHDPLADGVKALLEKTLKDIRRAEIQNIKSRERYEYWLKEIIKYLEGQEGNPDLLIDIYSSSAKD